jgi:hypothetical protein
MPGHAEFEVKKVTLKEVLLQELQFLPVSVTTCFALSQSSDPNLCISGTDSHY